ncbi:MAG TPA: hypothetical protein DDZ89_11490 [Clostridiales bacterium]|nr:hypothetical protein [Clostridiales bacterium]
MEIMEAAHELGNLIKKSEQYVNLKESEALALKDSEGVQLLNDLRILQSEYNKAIKEKLGNEAITSLKHLVEMKQEEIFEYRPTGLFVKAKNEFDAFMKEINDKIIEGITGEAPSCKSGGCSGCKSCGH